MWMIWLVICCVVFDSRNVISVVMLLGLVIWLSGVVCLVCV